MAFLKSPEFLNSTPVLNPGPAQEGTCRALLILYFPIKKADLSTSTHCSHPHGLTPPAKSPLWEPLHLSYFLESAHSVQLWEIHKGFQVVLWAHCPFSLDHTSILANGSKEKRLCALHCKSWGRGSPTFLGHTLFFRLTLNFPISGTSWVTCGKCDLRRQKVGANKVLGMEFGLIAWEGLGFKGKTLLAAHSVFLLLEATWLYAVIIAKGITSNLLLSTETVRETTEYYHHQAITNRVLMWYYINKF